MNRKISTLFTAGLLVAGSLCGSAWAKQINLPIGTAAIAGDKLAQGQEVFMSVNGLLYGFDEVVKSGANKGDIVPAQIISASSTTQVEEEELADYVWTVTWTTGASETSYKLVNKATGETLRIKKNGSAVEYNTEEKAENTISLFLFRDASGKSVAYGKDAAGNVATPSGLLTAVVGGRDYNLTWDATAASVVAAPTAGTLSFYAVETPNLTDVTELNALYNGNGFSFGVKTPDAKPLEGNLFGDQRIVARYTSGINVDNSNNPTYVSQRIPAGVYFFVGEAPAPNSSYSAWMNATVLVASSKETVEATVADREAGQGYSLVAKKIKDLNLYVEDNDPTKEWMSQGDEISILNACFTVNKTYVGDYPYALTIEKFRYRAKTTETKHEQKTVRLNVIGHSTNNYLATQALENPSFIFQLAASGMKDGIELLNKEAKAAVYNIRVMDGMGTDGKKIDKKDVRSAYGKYLTVGEQGGNLNFVAKAKVLVTEKAPAYQWVITEVYNNDVTFTNRETEESFTAKLFPVEGQADTYELAVNRVNADNGSTEASEVSNTNVAPIYVDQNTYNETQGSISAKLDKLVIELKPVEVDPYAGFLNVDDKTLVTMAFARDNNETSNKWYAAVNEDLKLCADDDNIFNIPNYFVNESSEAAQWQLIKKDAKKVVERSFVYNDNGHVVVKAKADVAYAYEYQLQYVNDGEETGYFFFEDGSSANGYAEGNEELVYDNTEKLTNAPKYIIKQNADGSVYLIASTKIVDASTPTILDEDTKSVVYVEAKEINKKYYGFYDIPSSVYGLQDDYTLNTYLITESPEVSYPAEEGYVYMQSELGDYISMNENRDGIVVDENPFNLFLHVTDKDAVIPSFYISRGIEGSADRAFLFHPQDSVDYYVADGKYDKKYQWDTDHVKAIFKAGQISESRDTMATMIKGELKNVAVKADDNGTFGGLKNFKYQIVLADGADDMYVVRSLRNGARYLYAVNDQLTWTSDKDQAMKFTISAGDPTSNESIADAAEGVKVIAGNGIVEIQGAAGKKVIVSNILGKVVAETVLTSDNATIAVPAGIIAVAVDGEAAVKAVVK